MPARKDSEKKARKSKKSSTKTVLKRYCPMCGSTRVGKTLTGWACARCTSRFPRPKTTRVTLKKKPKYIR